MVWNGWIELITTAWNGELKVAQKKEEAGSVNGVTFELEKAKYTGYFHLGEEMKPDKIMNEFLTNMFKQDDQPAQTCPGLELSLEELCLIRVQSDSVRFLDRPREVEECTEDTAQSKAEGTKMKRIPDVKSKV
ncbi:hypothetical protein BTVI_52001 [Pitangus sulphuratus]|nr:hypothetical protein BTVI_52001 [Pitangus sulphuratus]